MEPVHFPGHLDRYSGVVESALGWMAADWLREHRSTQSFLLAPKFRTALQRAVEISFFRDQLGLSFRILPFPPLAKESGASDGARVEAEWDRAAALAALLDRKKGDNLLFVTTPDALLDPVIPRSQLRAQRLAIRTGEEIPPAELARRLSEELGYDNEPVCERPGEFAVRGNLLDVYPVSLAHPVRIDFFGDEVESIRPFDPTSQLSEGNLREVWIGPTQGSAEGVSDGALADYLDRPTTWILEEPDTLRREHPILFEKPERPTHGKGKLPAPSSSGAPTLARIFERPGAEKDSALLLSEVETVLPLALVSENIPLTTKDPEILRGELIRGLLGADRTAHEESTRLRFLHKVAQLASEGAKVHLVLPGESEENRFREWMAQDAILRDFDPPILHGNLRKGAWRETETGDELYITDREIFGRDRTRLEKISERALPTRNAVDGLLDFSEMVEGDHLVHLTHGICIFRGIAPKEIDGETRELITLEFAEGIRISLPLTEAHLLSRYVGLRKSTPKLGKPGSGIWEKARRSAENSTLDLAAQLLEIQAKRVTTPGHAFAEDTPWQTDFESSFPFRETPDQLAAIQSAKRDMEKDRPMDRLVCGDVGFGKTEVAIRAIFKAVMDGKQAALLVPTTVLCQQHFQSFRDRFADFPLSVEMLSRFRTPSEQKRIRQQLKHGRIDVVVGTHSLLSKSVKFKDLGLLVIDEEHRFGVRQKEELKRMRTHVDVLSMSATPIPRTLYLALAGARDLSVIETPPRDRLPVETMVHPYSEGLIRSAVDQEISRGGQVFYLHNRVKTIRAVEKKLSAMFPRLRIAVGHGQMEEGELEQVMTEFVAGRYDLLLCTTIIESGLDIPNCNTMIIEGADRFGLSQLYQLRGRVGRFNRQAYAYLLLHRHTGVLESARKRLSAIRQYNQLGAGYRIAMKDLELRGAGNLIGSEQSGEIAGVGFDLYCQLLRQSIARLKGEVTASHVRAEVRLDFINRGMGGVRARPVGEARFEVFRKEAVDSGRIKTVAAEIPGEYIPESRIRVDLYRRLGLVSNREEMDRIEKEIADRFGKMPESVKILLAVTRIRLEAEYHQIASVATEGPLLRLKRTGKEGSYVKIGSRFPRLTQKKPLSRLAEITRMIARL
ncbi:transcription-repair coupling factor [Puniceicoccus vermicola]|uniref:Transcription-repair-coupling factor n=1 Tax=Puniceicoccus vermicola TaxID=388746 RepID=A0A7X1B4D7_9BACT|nr:transcription-repair coupling factor [Puniceicoccus vermicola]MBC2604170.1 transcription-repair coupling factor [Puniceicoccus vermicola]